MDKKQLNVKDILINNGIVILILLMVLFVGVTKQNFFSRSNFSNISINVACRFIIAVGVSGCLITKGTDLSAGRLVGLSACVFPPAFPFSFSLFCLLFCIWYLRQFSYFSFFATVFPPFSFPVSGDCLICSGSVS